ncbi:hypothetical protein BJ875DRAFT_218516 [Amylocarpus encephaloides]|uniref:N-acetyltransferase domain-containing protein n=1 Tax=Amylocarpus encephaloides TaxID=45428 RepID=A0A9P7Y8U4_9HELO|nr:hypothetical protein BJ875DRAFT_218516 [Amylocarpus encephaloides]
MEIHIRNATPKDARAMARIIIRAGRQGEESFPYKFPHYEEYPEDNMECTVNMLQTYMLGKDPVWDFKAMVAEVKLDDQSMLTISVAVWEVSAFAENIAEQRDQVVDSYEEVTNNGCENRRDADPARLEEWTKALDNARRQFLGPNGPVNGPLSYLHLQHIFTEPSYQKNGAATKLLFWGMRKADEHKLAIGAFASPMGQQFLCGLDFKIIAPVKVQVEGQEEFVVVTCMSRQAKS